MALDRVDKALLREAVFSGVESVMVQHYGKDYRRVQWRKDFSLWLRLRMRIRQMRERLVRA